jgi:membrane-associated phospholipid phosphatase
MFIKVESIYDFISLFAVLANIYILYSLEPVLIVGSGLCLFFHDFIKEATTGWYAPIFKRPDGAINCSLFNTGGLVDHKSGFPSGHVTIVSFLMNIMRFRNNKIACTNTNTYSSQNSCANSCTSSWSNIILYNIPVVLMGYARIMKGCHNLIQVIAGYLLGYCVAYILYKFEDDINHNLDKLYSYLSIKNKE